MNGELCNITCPGINEICLFRHLNWYLNKRTKSVFASELHGHKGFVEFLPTGFSTPVIKEIADLQIICFDPISRSFKLSFLQAKYHTKINKLNVISSFAGDALQWELLHNRPTVKQASKTKFPANILSHSCYDSIAGFGVFFNVPSCINMFFSAANLITPHNSNYTRKLCKRTLYSKTPNQFLNMDLFNPSKIETLACRTVCGYVESLITFKIGSPFQNEPSIVAYISNLLSLITQSPDIEGSPDLALTMLESLNTGDSQNDFNNKGYMNTLLIESNSSIEKERRNNAL